MVHLLSPDKVEDILHLQLLGGAVETNVRQKFVYIDRDTLIAQVGLLLAARLGFCEESFRSKLIFDVRNIQLLNEEE